MPVSDGYLTYVLDQFRTVLPAVRTRRMFGAYGLYAGELFFAVIDDDTLFLKVDDETRAEYEARGMPPFQPFEGAASMNYSQLPEELLEEPEALRPWVERAVAVAGRAKRKKRKAKRLAEPSAASKKPEVKKPAVKKTTAKKATAKKATAKKKSAGKTIKGRRGDAPAAGDRSSPGGRRRS